MTSGTAHAQGIRGTKQGRQLETRNQEPPPLPRRAWRWLPPRAETLAPEKRGSPVGGGGGCGNDPHTRRPGLPGAGEDLPLRPAVPCPDAGDTEHLRTRLLAVRSHVSVHLPLPGRLSPPAPGRLRARRGCRQARAEGTVSQTGASSSSHVAALLPKLTPCQVPDDPDLEAAQLLHHTVTARSRVSLLRAPRLSGIAARAWHEVGCSASPMRTGECPGHGCQV